MLGARLVRGAVWLLTTGLVAARLLAAPQAIAMPMATASRACAYQDTPVREASANDLRVAVACLIDRARARFGLPGLRQQPRLDLAAQIHDDQMVGAHYFAHAGHGSSPGARLDRAGYRWAALGEAIATGFDTPRQVVRGWLASTGHCQILLSPEYRAIGIGVANGEVRGYANVPGTWTADFALPAGSSPPSGDTGPADGCPY